MSVLLQYFPNFATTLSAEQTVDRPVKLDVEPLMWCRCYDQSYLYLISNPHIFYSFASERYGRNLKLDIFKLITRILSIPCAIGIT